MSKTRAIRDARTLFETPERRGKKYWPESTPLVGATPTLPDSHIAGLVKAAKSALEAEERDSES